jgi:hypothetical protein
MTTVALAWPMILANLAQTAMTAPDIMMMGQLAADALAAGALGSIPRRHDLWPEPMPALHWASKISIAAGTEARVASIACPRTPLTPSSIIASSAQQRCLALSLGRAGGCPSCQRLCGPADPSSPVTMARNGADDFHVSAISTPHDESNLLTAKNLLEHVGGRGRCRRGRRCRCSFDRQSRGSRESIDAPALAPGSAESKSKCDILAA